MSDDWPVVTPDLIGVDLDKVDLSSEEGQDYVERMAPKKLNQRHETMAIFAAHGWSNKRLADHFGFTQSRVSILMNSEIMKTEISRRREELYGGQSLRDQMDGVAQRAMDTIVEVMDNKEERGTTRVDAAKYLIDQSAGKAAQKVEHTGSMFKDMLQAMKEMQGIQPAKPVEIKADVIDVSSMDDKLNKILENQDGKRQGELSGPAEGYEEQAERASDDREEVQDAYEVEILGDGEQVSGGTDGEGEKQEHQADEGEAGEGSGQEGTGV